MSAAEEAARRFLARHFRVMATAVNVTDWPAYIRLCADAHESGSAWLDEEDLAGLREVILQPVRELADRWRQYRDGFSPYDQRDKVIEARRYVSELLDALERAA